MQTIYRPGSWYLLVRAEALVALPADTPGELVAALWDRLASECTLPGVIDTLASGHSVFDMPSFVAALRDGAAVRVAARGRVAIRVTAADGSADTVSGAEVSTWSERFITDAAQIDLTVDDVAPGEALPLGEGIVLAGAAHADVVSAPAVGQAEPSPDADAEAQAGTAGKLQDSVPEGSALEDSAPESPALEESAPESPASGPSGAADAPPPADDVRTALLDEVDGVSVATPAEGVDGSTLLPSEVTYAPAADEFDHLWGATQHTPIEAAAVRPEPESPEPESPDVPAGDAEPASPHAVPWPFGDHDGATISAAELRAQRTDAASADEAPTELLPQVGSSGSIRLSTGQRVALDRTVIIGRRPRSTRASGTSMPHLIAVDSPQQDISRNHLEIRPEGDAVVVIDLHTTNGSMLLRPGFDPVRLHPGEQTLVLDGDVIDLGDGVTVTFEGLT